MNARTETSASRPIGAFPVTVDAARVRDYAKVAGASTNSVAPVPFAFPICWLSPPEIRVAIIAAVQEDSGIAGGVLPVHLDQTIALSENLRVGEDYLLSLAVDGPDPRRIVQITGQITAPDGRAVGSLELRLALVTCEGAQAASRPRS